MFLFFSKDPVKKLKKEYSVLLQRAMEVQRKRDIRTYSELTAKAEMVMDELSELEGK